jgi:succinyl-CoA synthetase beta subunit
LFIGAGPLTASRLLDEAESKAVLGAAGIAIPEGRVAEAQQAGEAAGALGFPVAVKMLSDRLPHKTEAGAVRLGLASAEAVANAVDQMTRDVAAFDALAVSGRFLIERMAGPPLAELLVSIRRDPQFGLAMTLASGGVLVELIGDAVTVLLPASRADLDAALGRLRVSRLIAGHRGKPAGDRAAILDCLERLVRLVAAPASAFAEVEINPLFVLPDGVVAVDVLIRVAAVSA